jgi:hypothetical protein
MEKLKRRIGGVAKRVVRSTGFDIVRYSPDRGERTCDFTPWQNSIIKIVEPYTMTSRERLHALIEAIRYVSNAGISGDVVECGVWKGGSMMAVALALMQFKASDRHLYLFDTFEGMPQPRAIDSRFDGMQASEVFEAHRTGNDSSDYCCSPIEDVERALRTTGYPSDLVHLVKGKVERTIPDHAPKSIALLRLDTDWYESTKHELEHLYPRLQRGGILIIDDYGHWQGCKAAVDEYFNKTRQRIFLSRIDYTGRIGIKA